MSADRDDAAALHREEPRARGDCVRRNRAAPPYQCGRPPSALQSWAHLAGWIQTVVQALGRCVGTAAILHAATRALHPAISGFPNRGLVRSHPSAHRRRRGRLLRHSSIRRNSRRPHDRCRPVASDPPVRRSPGCAHAAGEHPHGRLVCVRRLLPDALDRRGPRSALCPVCSALCRPYSSADSGRRGPVAPPLLGSRLSAELAAISPMVRTKSTTVADPPGGEIPSGYGLLRST